MFLKQRLIVKTQQMNIMSSPVYLDDYTVKSLLRWDTVIASIEKALAQLSSEEDVKPVIQPPRLIMPIPQKTGVLLNMPAYVAEQNALGCKLVTSFKNNTAKGLPSIYATILLFDDDTGKVKMIMDGTEITAWRTAAASAVATKHIHRGEKRIIAILGAGVQGRSHALAFKHYFNFSEIRIWNRTFQRAQKLCQELGEWAVPYESNESCVRGADVIVTCTYSPEPVVLFEWLKQGAHINAVGFGVNHHNELSASVYKNCFLVVDSREAADKELANLIKSNIPVRTEVGNLINKTSSVPLDVKVTVFHSLGMAVEDVVTANTIYEAYMEKRRK